MNKIRRRGYSRAMLAAAQMLAVAAMAGAGSAEAQDVNITANDPDGVNLDLETGSTVRVAPGIIVDNSVRATAQPWSLDNEGTINGFNAVELTAGGTIDNASGATIAGRATAVTTGRIGVVTSGEGYITNAGTIIGGTAEGVSLFGGGTVTNLTGATISAAGLNAVSASGGTIRRVVNDGTIINTRTTGFASGILIQGAPAEVTNQSNGVISGSYNGIYTSRTAPLTLINDGIISSVRGPAVESIAGGVFTNTGTIQSGVDGIFFGGAGSIQNSGVIGSTGAGRSIVFSGAADHALILDTGSVLNGNVQGGTGLDALALEGTGSESIGKFLAFETLTMRGSDWTLNGSGAFTQSAVIEEGVLRVTGQLTSPSVTIQDSGTLTGTGAVAGAVETQSGGTLAVGQDNLTVQGNYTHRAGGIFSVVVTPAPASNGVLTITGGAALIEGGEVRVTAGAGDYAPNTQYAILTADGGVTGAFDGAVTNFAFLAPSITYDPNTVFLTLTRNAFDFEEAATTRNQRSAARAADALGDGNPVYDAIVLLDEEDAPRAFDAISGEIHASLKSMLVDDSRFVREAVLHRLRGASAPNARNYGPALSLWGQAFGARGDLGGDGNAASLERETGGAFAGADVVFGEGVKAGFAAGYSEADMGSAARASMASVDSYHVALYGGVERAGFGLRGGAAYARHRVETERRATFPGFSQSLRANYHASTAQAFAEAGYALRSGPAEIEPFAALAIVNIYAESFREAGGAAALSARDQSDYNPFSTIGLRFAAQFAGLGDGALSVYGSAAWRHAFDDVSLSSSLDFEGGQSFGVNGTPIARDAAALEAGVSFQATENVTFGAGYSGQIAPDAEDHGVNAKLNIRF